MKRKKQVENNMLPLAAVICGLSLVVMLVALSTSGRQTQTVEFTPPPFDLGAVAGTPVVPENLPWQELDCQAYKVGICGKLGADGQIWLFNPEGNDVWLKVRVLDEQGNILGETGLIKPGEYVQTVELTTLPQTGTPITLKIMAYEPDTYHSAGAASLNTTFA